MMSEDQQTHSPRKVGPGNPPEEHRFQRGAPSPNPLGRPPKPRREDGLMQKLAPWASRIAAFDSQLLPTRDENREHILSSRGDLALKRLFQKAMKEDNIAAMKLYLQLTEAAKKEVTEHLHTMLAMAEAHREKYLVMFASYEYAGRRLPEIFPDPRDIIVNADGTVTIEGPMDLEARAVQDVAVQRQTHLIEAIAILHKYAMQGPSPEEKSTLRKLKRELAAINKALPSRLRRVRL